MMALCSTAMNNAGDVRRRWRSAMTICDGKACCDAKLACEIASAILAFVAAVFWFSLFGLPGALSLKRL